MTPQIMWNLIDIYYENTHFAFLVWSLRRDFYMSPYILQLIHNCLKMYSKMTNQFFDNPSPFIGRLFGLMIHEMIH